MRTWRQILTLSLAVAALSACDDGSGPAGTAPVSLSFLTGTGSGSPALAAVTLTDGAGNALEIESVEMVLRDVEFERTEAVADCDAPAGEDSCEEIRVGPEVATLPLDATMPVVAFEAAVPVGSFKEVEFEVHKLDDMDPSDAALIMQRPQFDDISILVTGTWTPAGGSATPFTFSSDLNEDQEIEFATPLVLVEGEAKNVTFVVDLGGWFRDGSGNLFDPESANKGGPNENLVKDNVRGSIEGFEDDDHDGQEDN
ncbi:MAG: hypothetical protein ACREKI_03595 [Gemmatimonadota bacterium]